MNYSLCLQATPKHVDIALCKNEQIIKTIQIPNHTSSAQLIPCIDQLLEEHAISLKDCMYIAANQGPAPFTTLRTILATINGIHCATGIPLVGIDGLKGLVSQHRSKDYTYTIALLNAFNNELYYAIDSQDACITGYGSTQETAPLIESIIKDNSALLIGNGVEMLKNQFPSFFDKKNIAADFLVEHCTIADIVQLAWAAWNSGSSFKKPLMPLYLKKHAVER